MFGSSEDNSLSFSYLTCAHVRGQFRQPSLRESCLSCFAAKLSLRLAVLKTSARRPPSFPPPCAETTSTRSTKMYFYTPTTAPALHPGQNSRRLRLLRIKIIRRRVNITLFAPPPHNDRIASPNPLLYTILPPNTHGLFHLAIVLSQPIPPMTRDRRRRRGKAVSSSSRATPRAAARAGGRMRRRWCRVFSGAATTRALFPRDTRPRKNRLGALLKKLRHVKCARQREQTKRRRARCRGVG